jgi:Mlc titration factor MtfA (ptsG expression regulator)
MFFFKKLRRRRIAAQPFPGPWLNILQKDVVVYNYLDDPDKVELRKNILIFLAEKHFESCGGFILNQRVKIIIAAYACILLLHRRTDYYPGLYSILVYPDAFIANHKEYLPGGLVAEGPQVYSGQSWRHGIVVLSWDDIEYDKANVHDGRNVIYHEFAHQIDSSAGRGDSSAVLKTDATFNNWSKVLYENYIELRDAAESGEPFLLDEYGATEPSEFFAVATEFFFEKPYELNQQHPKLYEELVRFYNINPVNFI